jgi:hypothetical protein
MTEAQISDVYVRLGNDFNAAVAAFAVFNIDMSCVISYHLQANTLLRLSISSETSCPYPKTYEKFSKLV